MVDYREQILSFIGVKGPILPVHVAKVIGKDLLVSSAMLSEMVSKGMLRITHMKIGGSPLYYKQGQEDQLLQFTSNFGDKERQVLEYLKSQLLIDDSTLEPLPRVILGTLKDFAISIKVKTNVESKMYWKWYLFSDEDAKSMLQKMLEPKAPEPKAEPKVEAEPVTHEEKKSEDKKVEENKPEEKKYEMQTTIREEKSKKEKLKKKGEPKPAELKAADPAASDSFNKKIISFFQGSSIKVVSYLTQKGAKDKDYVIEYSTPLGVMRLFCRAVCKKKISDSDVNSAYIEANKLRLPLVLLAEGLPGKATQERIDRDFKGILIKKI